MNANCVVFIDDQPNYIEYFVQEVKRRGFQTKVIKDVDEAIAYFSLPRPDVAAVVLDIIMPPGRDLWESSNEEGLWTGVYLYGKISSLQGILRASGFPLPIAVLTQRAVGDAIHMLEELGIKAPINEKFQIWQKVGLEADQFAMEFETWLQALRELYGSLGK